MNRSSACKLLLVSTTLSTPAFADVLDVGPNGSPYLQIRDAVAAAADGDLIRVQPGFYESFDVTGKDVSVVGSESGVVVQGGVVIRDTAFGTLVHLAGIEILPVDTEGLRVIDCDGSVRIDACELSGTGVFDPVTSQGTAFPAFHVERSHDVAFAVSQAWGAAAPGIAGPGGVLIGSTVSLHDSKVYGGTPLPCEVRAGGPALDVSDQSHLFAQASILRGGDTGTNNNCGTGVCMCSTAGPGLHISDSSAALFGSLVTAGGSGPTSGDCPFYGCGGTNPNIVSIFSSISAGQGPAATLTMRLHTMREGQTLDLGFAGRENDLVLLGIALGGQTTVLPHLAGNLLIDPPHGTNRIFVGALPASGKLSWSTQLPELRPAVHLPLHLQAAHRAPGIGGQVMLGPVRVLHVLDSVY